MPFALVLIGLIMIVTGAKGTQKEFGRELVSDFTGPGNFTWWIVSIGALGALGYVDKLRTFSRTFMALVIISMILSNRGFFDQFTKAINTGPEKIKASGANDNSGPQVDQKAFFDSVGNLSAQSNAGVSSIMQENTKRIDSAGKTAANIISTAFKAFGM